MPARIKYSSLQTFLLWLLMVSGPLKPFFYYWEIDIDLTLAVFIIVSIDIIYASLVHYSKIRFTSHGFVLLFLLLLFYAYLLITLTYTASPSFSKEKSALFLVNILFFVYPLFIQKYNLELIYRLYTWIFLPAAVVFILAKTLYFLPINSDNRIIAPEFYEIRQKYLGLGLGVGIHSILAVYLNKPRAMVLLGLLIITGLGARGALIFLIFSLAFLIIPKLNKRISNFKAHPKKILKRVILVTTPITILGIIYFNKIVVLISNGINRFSSLLDFGSDKSSQGRLERMVFALNHSNDNPFIFLFGNGIGSFGILYSGNDTREYPHNVFIEVLFELGIVGLALILFIFVVPLLRKNHRFFIALYLFFLLNAMKSNDLISLWLLFMCIGFLAFYNKDKLNGYR